MNEAPEHAAKLSPLWLKAAVAGGLWASVEIIVGSFLHNIRIPFAGAVLASFGVMLMVAFYRMWPERGLIWRAGIICALMKSISPSANILGPMISITMEAFLLDMFLRLLGKNLPSVMLAGGISVLSAFAYKLFSMLVIFGFNLVKLYMNIFDFAARQIGYTSSDPLILIIVIALMYFAWGMVAAVTGFMIGQRYKTVLPDVSKARKLSRQNIDSDKNNPRFSSLLLLLHILLIPAGILLLNNFNISFALPWVAAYVFFCMIRYPLSWRRIRKPFLWVQLLLTIILAGFFWSSTDETAGSFDYKGWMAGLHMLIRAMLIISAFSGISHELRNPMIRLFLFRRGFRQLYSAVSLAFQALPAMLEESIKPGELFRRPLTIVAQMLANAGKWEEIFQDSDKMDLKMREGL